MPAALVDPGSGFVIFGPTNVPTRTLDEVRGRERGCLTCVTDPTYDEVLFWSPRGE